MYEKLLLNKCYAKCAKRWYVLHIDAISLYEGIFFNLPLSYARTLTVLFVSFTYCNAFPILMYLFCIYVNWQYWMEKYMILRHYKIPLRISTSIHENVMKTLPYCLLMHLFHSWWFYGSPGILNNCCFDPNKPQYDTSVVKTRVGSRYGLPFLVLACILFCVLLFKNTFIRLQDCIKMYLKGTKVEPLGIARHFQQDKELMEKTGIISYDIKKNPYYSMIFKAIEGCNKYYPIESTPAVNEENFTRNKEKIEGFEDNDEVYSNMHDAEYETGELKASESSKKRTKASSPPSKRPMNAWVKDRYKEDRIDFIKNGISKTAGSKKDNNLSYDCEEESKGGRNSGDTVQQFEFDDIDNSNKIDFNRLKSKDQLSKKL